MSHVTSRPRNGEREVRRLLGSVAVSSVGTWSYNVGIAVYAYEVTGSTAWVAAATVGRYLPALAITSVGSRWAQRWPRREVAVSADAFCAVMMLLLTVVAVVHGPLVLAIALAAMSSGVSRVQSAAAMAAMADVVPESRLTRTAAVVSSTDAVAAAVGPALASLLLAVTVPAVLFALNGFTFLASALLVAGLPDDRRAAGPRRTVARRDDHAYRRALHLVWPLIAARTVLAVVYGADVVLLAVLATQQLKQGTAGYGWLLAAAGAGGLVGAAMLRRRGEATRVLARTVAGTAAASLPILVFLVTPLLPVAVLVQAVRGIGAVTATAVTMSALQRSTPASSSTRVFGTTHVAVMVGTSIGAVVAPLLVGAWGLDVALVVLALAPMAAVALLAVPLVRFDAGSAATLAELEPHVDVLRRLALFEDANRSTLYGLADALTPLDVDQDVPVVRVGEASDSLYVLVDGAVEVTGGSEAGPVVLRRMEAVDYFGEIGLLHGVTRTATVTCTTPCRLWRIPAEAFHAAVSQAGLSGTLHDAVRTRLATTAG